MHARAHARAHATTNKQGDADTHVPVSVALQKRRGEFLLIGFSKRLLEAVLCPADKRGVTFAAVARSIAACFHVLVAASVLQNNENRGLNPRLHLQALLQADAHDVLLKAAGDRNILVFYFSLMLMQFPRKSWKKIHTYT